MVTLQEICCVGQLPVTVKKYQRKSTEKMIYLAHVFTLLSFGSDGSGPVLCQGIMV